MLSVPKIEINGKEYFSIRRFSFDHSVQYGMALKTCAIDCNVNSRMLDFFNLLEQKKTLLATVYLQDKVFLEGFITFPMIKIGKVADTGAFFTFNLYDRFYSLAISDTVTIGTYKKIKTLEQTLEILLNEFHFVSYKDPISKITTTYPYQKSISSEKDFISVGYNVKRPIIIEKYGENYGEFKQKASDVIGRLCNINQKIIISNGYDTLKIENINEGSPQPVYILNDSQIDGNVMTWNKGGNSNDIQGKHIDIYNNPSKIANEKDNNTLLILNYLNGLPNIKQVRNINRNMSASDIKKHIDYEMAQINANSRNYSITITAPSFLDINKNFLEPNKIVSFKSDNFGIREDMTILSVSGEVEPDGIRCVLGCSPVEVFKKEANQKFKKGTIKR